MSDSIYIPVIKQLEVTGVEKRTEKLVGSYFMYRIYVKNNINNNPGQRGRKGKLGGPDKSSAILFRKYSELYDFHSELLYVMHKSIKKY